MNSPKFILSKNVLLNQLKRLEELELKVSYSYKTNKEVGNLLQQISDVDFSLHREEEIEDIKDKNKIWFFVQAESDEEIKVLLDKGIKSFVVDNELDLKNLLDILEELESQENRKNEKNKITISLRMKFQEHRVGTGKYFVYGMPSKTVNRIILELKKNNLVERIGVHIHRKSQNTSEWGIKEELSDSLSKESLESIDLINLGGGLPIEYKSYEIGDYNYIFEKLKETKIFLDKYGIISYIEPGRFLAGAGIKLETEIIQIYDKNIVINTSVYDCALDTILTGTKLLIEDELKDEERGEYYLIKGNSPTRDDIFRYKVKLKNPKVGDKIIFLNAGAYNYTTDFFGYKKIETIIAD